MAMQLRGIALVCLIVFPAGQAAAQVEYSFPPRVAAAPYPDDPPPGTYERALRRYDRRQRARDFDDDGDQDGGGVIARRGVSYGVEVTPEPPFVRYYYRVAPGRHDGDPRPRRYLRDDAGPIAPTDGGSVVRERDWQDRRAALPPPGAARIPGQQVPDQRMPVPSNLDDTIKPQSAELPPRLRRQIVDYRSKEPAGSIVVDTRNTYLYYVLGDGEAVRYGIGVGREGFGWSGREKVSRMTEWPDWYPPKDMIAREPYLPRMMAGGPGNPLGARALYLGNSLYRIHGTADVSSIGKHVSSGCIRMLNEDVADLYARAHVGTRVVVLRGARRPATASARR